VIVVRRGDVRRGLRDNLSAGLVPISGHGAAASSLGTGHRPAAESPLAAAPIWRPAAAGPGGFAEHLDEYRCCSCSWPICAPWPPSTAPRTATHSRRRLVYPFAWSILLAARTVGLAGVMTTMATRHEDDVRALLSVPDHFAWPACSPSATRSTNRRSSGQSGRRFRHCRPLRRPHPRPVKKARADVVTFTFSPENPAVVVGHMDRLAPPTRVGSISSRP